LLIISSENVTTLAVKNVLFSLNPTGACGIRLHVCVNEVHLAECLNHVPEQIVLKAVIGSDVQFF
jgi:hypothetical protein